MYLPDFGKIEFIDFFIFSPVQSFSTPLLLDAFRRENRGLNCSARPSLDTISNDFLGTRKREKEKETNTPHNIIVHF